MPYSSKKPKLTYREIADQIYKRTGFPLEVIKSTMDAYYEITEEALLGQVEVPFGRIGCFSWRQVEPRKGVVTWNFQSKDYNKPTNLPGFQKTVFKVGTVWASYLKNATLFNMGEKNPVDYDDEAEEEDKEE